MIHANGHFPQFPTSLLTKSHGKGLANWVVAIEYHAHRLDSARLQLRSFMQVLDLAYVDAALRRAASIFLSICNAGLIDTGMASRVLPPGS